MDSLHHQSSFILSDCSRDEKQNSSQNHLQPEKPTTQLWLSSNWSLLGWRWLFRHLYRHTPQIVGSSALFLLFLLLLVVPRALRAEDLKDPNATPQPQGTRTSYDHLRAAPSGPCVGLFKLEGTDYCTHGPDEPPPGVDVDQPVEPLLFAAGVEAEPVLCDGDGVSGNRVQVVYIRASDQPDRFAQYEESIQQWAADVDRIYDLSAQETGGTRHIRFVHDAQCRVIVLNQVIPAQADDSFTTSISAIQSQGLNRTDRKYLMFVDSTVFCGIGGTFSDESDAVTNRNNSGPSYARVDSGCWGARVAAHELMHNFGGVQFGAPNASGGYHCTDEWDVMCYSDAPHYPTVTIKCPDQAHETLLDCNHDDYYNTNPPSGSYLATHWNPAFNQFLIWENQPLPTPTLTPTPLPTLLPNCRVYPALSLPMPIYDQQMVTATINVPDPLVVSRVRLVNLQIQHTYLSDLSAALISPNHTEITLFHAVGSNKRDFLGTAFDDEAAQPISQGEAPFSAAYRPAEPLSNFINQSATGSWQLQITDSAFRDAGFLADVGLELCSSLPLPDPLPTQTLIDTPTPTPTSGGREFATPPTPTPTSPATPGAQSLARLTVKLVVEPESIQDFRFTLNEQVFTLDNPLQDDGDTNSNRYTALLEPGQYMITQLVPHTWFLSNIGCTLSAAVEMQVANPTVSLTLTPGADITCTFRSQRNVIIRTQTYEDGNQNQQYDDSEAWLADWNVKLYNNEGELLQSQLSNHYGKANFNGLPAGRYQVCQTVEEGWQPTIQHGQWEGEATQNCIEVLLAPAQVATVRFGNARLLNTATNPSSQVSNNGLLENDLNYGVEISLLADVTDDVDGYGNSILMDEDLNTPVLTWHYYLPFLNK